MQELKTPTPVSTKRLQRRGRIESWLKFFNALVRSLNNPQDGCIWSRPIGPAVVALLVWLLLAFSRSTGSCWRNCSISAADLDHGLGRCGWPRCWAGWAAGSPCFTLAYMTAMLLAAIFIRCRCWLREIGAASIRT